MPSAKSLSVIGLITMGLTTHHAIANINHYKGPFSGSESTQSSATQHSETMLQDHLNQAGGLLKSATISYPKKAQRESIEGWVELQIEIDEDGQVADVTVLNAKPSRIFEKAAINGVQGWQFKKKLVNGQAVSYQHNQTIDFKLINYTMVNGKHVIGKQ